MAKSSKVKVSYTYNGITFSTASKVVAKMAVAGHMKSAYKRYLSDTVGKQLRTLDLSKANRLQYLRAAEIGKIEPERIVKAVKAYKEIVAMNIADNIKSIYDDVFVQLSGMDNKAARDLIHEIDDIIAEYSNAYDVTYTVEMNQKIQNAIEHFKNNTQLSERDMQHFSYIDESMSSIGEQFQVKVDAYKKKMAAREANKK